MATATKKTTTTKAAVKTEEKVETPVVEETKNVEETKSPTIEVNADELIKSIINNVNANNTEKPHSKEYVMCKSVKVGGLNINCKSGNVYEFTDYDSECEIEYHDLAALVRKRSDHLFLPRIVVEDDDFIEEFPQLKKVYESMYTMEDMDELFDLPPHQMIAAIKAMPTTVAESLKSVISTRIANGQIDSVRTIKALNDYYDCDFSLISELFSR